MNENRGLRGITRPKSDGLVLHENLSSIFKDLRLSDVKKRLVIPSFALSTKGGRGGRRQGVAIPTHLKRETIEGAFLGREVVPAHPQIKRMGSWKTVIYDTIPASMQEDKTTTLVVDMLMGTCAAPSYFPPYRGMIDGSLVANNPTMIAITQALSRSRKSNDEEGKCTIQESETFPRREDLLIVSLSTGCVHQAVGDESIDWGRGFALRFGRPLSERKLILHHPFTTVAQWVSPIIIRRLHPFCLSRPRGAGLLRVSRHSRILHSLGRVVSRLR